MKRGDVRLFEGGKVALVAALGIWADRTGKYIRIDMTGDGQNFKHVVVTNNPESVKLSPDSLQRSETVTNCVSQVAVW